MSLALARCCLFSVFLISFSCRILCAIEIAITLDDHPMPTGNVFTLQERVARYCETFAHYGCQGGFFCIGSNCQEAPDPSCLTLLNGAGHFLANHSLSHKHLSTISLEDFEQEILATEVLLAPYSHFRKWFRFPYLDYGNRMNLGGTEEKFAAALAILKKHGYKEGFVTINTFDWYIDSLMQKTLRAGKKIDYAQLREAYLALLKDWCSYYISFYNALFAEEVTHVLLLHANDLNALFMGDVLEMMHQNGWKIASPEKAFTDPPWRAMLLKHPELITGKPPTMNGESIDLVLQTYHVFP